MKYSNVKEIVEEPHKEKIEKQSFENKIMNLYPDLFHKDSEGKPIPADCGIYCPPGWEHLVENLCSSIDSYVKHAEVSTQKHKVWFATKMFFYSKFIMPIGNGIFRILDPYKLYQVKENTKYQTWWVYKSDISKLVKEKHPRRLALSQKVVVFFSWFRPYYKWNKEKVPAVYIDQIKEKFGNLRYYYSGGNEAVSGMVRLAESISMKTCEESGMPGVMCQKGKGMKWYRTLAPKMAKKFGYVPVKSE